MNYKCLHTRGEDGNSSNGCTPSPASEVAQVQAWRLRVAEANPPLCTAQQGHMQQVAAEDSSYLRAQPCEVARILSHTMYQLDSFRKSTPPQNCELVALISNIKQ